MAWSMLPAETISPRVSLALYSAQRWRAKIWRAALTLLLKTPAAAVFHRITLGVGERSEMMQFLAEQSGLPAVLKPKLRLQPLVQGPLAVGRH